MPLDSITERTFTRSVHFEEHSKEEALSQTAFYQEQIAYYLANVFGGKKDYTFTCEQKHDTDRKFTIRKGSAILTVTAVFGINMSYKEHPPRKFYTFTTTASRHNEVLDTTNKANDVIEWTFRITGGVILGGVFIILLVLFGGHTGLHFITFAFGMGSGAGGFIGHLIARKIYYSMETRLQKRGEITEIETEWSSLTDTLDLVFSSR
jgi:hypothetical protein